MIPEIVFWISIILTHLFKIKTWIYFMISETTIFWPYYSGKCRTVGTYSPRRNHGRATASRQTKKTVDTRHWRVDWLRIHSAKGDVTRSSTMAPCSDFMDMLQRLISRCIIIIINGEERYRSGRLLSPTLIEEGRLVSEWVRTFSLICHHHPLIYMVKVCTVNMYKNW